MKNRQVKTYTVKNRNDAERTAAGRAPGEQRLHARRRQAEGDGRRRVPLRGQGARRRHQGADASPRSRRSRPNYSISTSDDDQIRFLISQPLASEKVKAGLQKALELRLAKSKTTVELAELRRQLASILEDQTRMRANIKELPTNSRDPQAPAEEVRRAGDADREVPRRHQEARGHRARAGQGLPRLPRRLHRRVKKS